ncbi:MAG: mycofactocin radical SAM maturase [Gemmatimonadaceae bacterium]
MTDTNLSAFRDMIRPRALRERTPLSCIFEITPRCNLRCHFCYVALDPYSGPYLSAEQIGRVYDKLVEAGILWLTLTGGEIFSRRDFAEVYSLARSKGLVVSLYSNATMVTERIAALLASDPPEEIQVSIYGSTATRYEAVTGIKGSFARFARGVDLLRGAGLNVVMKHVASNTTEDDVQAMLEWCKARGMGFKVDGIIENRHDGGHQPSLYRIAPRGVTAFRDQLHEMSTGTKRGMPLAECAVASDGPGAAEQLYRCGAGRISLFVDALGNASHCILDRDPSFPILDMEWDDLWTRMGRWVTQPLPAEAPCSGCGLRGGCNNCPARSRLATGSPFLKDTYHCDITHAEFGLPPQQHPDYRTTPRPLGACVA